MGAINPKICETLHLTSPLTISLRREKFFSILRFCEWVGAFLVDLCEAGYVSSSTQLLQRSGENGVCVCECDCVHAWPALFVIPAMVFGDTLLWNRLFEMRESIAQTAEGPRRWSEWDGAKRDWGARRAPATQGSLTCHAFWALRNLFWDCGHSCLIPSCLIDDCENICCVVFTWKMSRMLPFQPTLHTTKALGCKLLNSVCHNFQLYPIFSGESGVENKWISLIWPFLLVLGLNYIGSILYQWFSTPCQQTNKNCEIYMSLENGTNQRFQIKKNKNPRGFREWNV